MAFRKVKSKSFKLKKEATDWAKEEKKKSGTGNKVRWETNRTKNNERPWEAVIYRDIN